MLYIVPTIDVEGVHGRKPFEQMINGEIGDEKQWGVYRIAELFAKYNIQGTFFVDVYESSLWGEEQIKRVCEKLDVLGQDVQLHTHPAWRDDIHDFRWLRDLKKEKSYVDQKFDMIARAPLNLQIEILSDGIDMLANWLKKKPIAHRSGGYSLNQETLQALRQTGMRVDSSMNPAHDNSKVNWSTNQIIVKENLMEIPVTVMEYVFKIFGHDLYRKKIKTDIDVCSLKELFAYVEQALSNDIRVLTLFMHSYSFIQFDTFYKRMTPDSLCMIKLEKFIKEANTRRDIKFASCSQLFHDYNQNNEIILGNSFIPSVNANLKIIYLAIRKAKNKVKDILIRKLL